MSLRKTKSGFTLIELLVTLALVAIVLSLAAPAFNQMIENNRRTAAVNDLIGLLNFARSEAVRRSLPVRVSKVDGALDASVILPGGATESIRTLDEFEGGMEVNEVGSGPLHFAGSGLSDATGGNFQYRVCASGSDGTVVEVNAGGQISKQSALVSCP